MTLNDTESSPNIVSTQIKSLILTAIPSISIRALTSPHPLLPAPERAFRARPGVTQAWRARALPTWQCVSEGPQCPPAPRSAGWAQTVAVEDK